MKFREGRRALYCGELENRNRAVSARFLRIIQASQLLVPSLCRT